ncbi:MAG: serine carboxypeptidase [Chloroflexi bacterium RBG_16_57_11]|nr:MAG: serine carboxypeptidase [Chloroflexi bacterium RBG_16_57_11]
MKRILVIHLGFGQEGGLIEFQGQQVEVKRLGCGGDVELARRWIADHDDRVDAIGLEGLPAQIRLGGSQRAHQTGITLANYAQATPVVDGSGVRAGLERWGVILADRAQPGIFSQKRILLVPGLNHEGMAQAFSRHTSEIRYADPVVYFAMPDFTGLGRRLTLEQVASPTLEQLKDAPFRRIFPQPGRAGTPRVKKPFEWADVLAGDIGAIRRYAPAKLARKTVVVNAASEEDLDDLRQRGVSIAVIMIPNLDGGAHWRGWGDATVEAVLASLRPDSSTRLSEDTYLDLIADLDWRPDLRYLQPDEAGINRFAFVIHPLEVGFIHKHPLFRWTRYLPDAILEPVAAVFPPIYLSRITGGQSPATGQRIEGYLISLGATPRQMMSRGERFTYKRLNMAARMAERRGARILGLGAFTSVVGDAGITVAHEADIAITSGNSLTVAATLEAAKQAVIKMGATDLTRGKAMVIGATGSIGSVCARLLAQAIYVVVLISIEPERLIDLKRKIMAETPGAHVTIGTRADEMIGECDLIVTSTSAFGQRVLDITRCKPGAVICDVARPPDINPAEADLRPDVLVIESGEVLVPGDINFGYDIGLPPKTAYACLAETALLAMEGRFEDYTLGRNISLERVKEIYHLFKKHNFQLAGLRSFGKYITDEDIQARRQLADQLRNDPERFTIVKREASEKLEAIAPMAKGVRSGKSGWQTWLGVGVALGALGLLLYRRQVKNKK